MTMRRLFSSPRIRFVSWTFLIAGLAATAAPWTLGGAHSKTATTTYRQTRKSTDAPVAAKGKFGQDLFLAIDHRDLPAVQALLKNGADPNARNGLEFTPLYIAAASHQTDVMKELLNAGAKPDAESTYGTPLIFAAETGNVEGFNLLLSKGVDINAARTDGLNALMMASNTGVPPIVAELLKRKADVNEEDDSGATALTLAARGGHTEIGQMLLSGGAIFDKADSNGRTPLMEAAINGHPEFVKILLAKGAKPNARDAQGRTALILAASYGDYPEVVKALIAGGADSKGAGAIAASRGYTETAKLLGAPSVTKARDTRQAVGTSLKLIQASMLKFNQMTSCVSCHQDGLGRITTGEAGSRGFKIDPAVQNAQVGRINGALNALKPLHLGALKDPNVMKQVPLIEINEVATIDGWLLNGMAASNQQPNEASAAMALVLARQQQPDGHWSFSLPRVPMQSSFFTFTALAIRSLQTYGPKSSSAEIDERIGRAKDWLMKSAPQNSEDRASRLLGLKWAGADAAEIQKATDAVRADQRKDGGWSQLPNLQSDAYATGQALYALHVGGGLPASDPVYKAGANYLLRTQDSDGSWYVNKRALPANNYFDAGFPHGESQYSSFNGTCWATLALLETIERPRGQATKRKP